MKAVLYIPYANGDAEKGFNYKGESLTPGKFIKMVQTDYNGHKYGVDYMMRNNVYGNLSINQFQKEHYDYEHQDYAYGECKCDVYDMNQEDETIDDLIIHYQKGDQFIIILKLHGLKGDPDIETDLKSWMVQSNKIQHSALLSDHEKMYNLPKKDFRIHFEDAGSNAILEGCKIMETYSSTALAILVKKIIFIRTNQ